MNKYQRSQAKDGFVVEASIAVGARARRAMYIHIWLVVEITNYLSATTATANQQNTPTNHAQTHL